MRLFVSYYEELSFFVNSWGFDAYRFTITKINEVDVVNN